jgi:hypothetical protein
LLSTVFAEIHFLSDWGNSMPRSFAYWSVALLGILVASGTCRADSNLAFNGFETGTGDWSFATSGVTGDANGSITQTASGAGPLGLTAFDGSFYGTVHGNTNGYAPGLANGGASFFGFDTAIPPYPGSPFSQEISVYINVKTPAPSNAAAPAFWIDESPSSTSPKDAGTGGVGFGGEQNFRLTYTGSTVKVSANGTTPLATITTSGWYTFQMIYFKGATATSLAMTTLNVLNPNGVVVGSASELDDMGSNPLQSQYLAGPGYVWIPQWQNGFSNDYLGIDDVRADALTAAPEPGVAALLGLGLLAAMGCALRQRSASLATRPS